VLGDGDDGDATLPSRKSKKRRGQPLDDEAPGLDFESMEVRGCVNTVAVGWRWAAVVWC
jgi:hypothetical protein